MAVDDTAPRAQRPGPIALADLFDAALKDLAPKSSSGAPASLPAPTPTPPTSCLLYTSDAADDASS
ncbi:hypothetical protein ACM9NO_29360, partial [Pseudomonas paraeruginosa]